MAAHEGQSVLLIGDSHLEDTSCDGLSQLGPRLRDKGFEVTSLAVGGLTTRAGLDLYSHLPTDQDWCVISFGANDAAPCNEIPVDEFAANYRDLLGRVRPLRMIVLGPAPVLESAAEAGGRSNERLRALSAVASSAAAEFGAVFLGLVDDLTVEDHLATDGLHLNEAAYGRLASVITSIIDETTV